MDQKLNRNRDADSPEGRLANIARICALAVLGILITSSSFPALATESQERGRLIALLSLPLETVCAGTQNQPMDAAITFTNQSEQDVEVAMEKGIGVTVMGLFGTRTLRPLLWGGGSNSEWAPRTVSAHFLMHPKETILYRLQLRLDENVFSEPGFYKVQVGFDASGHATSPGRVVTDFGGITNWVVFESRECGKH